MLFDITRDNSQVQKVRAYGGNDGPEDVLHALARATDLKWQAKARFLVLVADSPAHGSECNDDPTDLYPSGVNNGYTVKSVMQALQRKEIDLMVCKAR